MRTNLPHFCRAVKPDPEDEPYDGDADTDPGEEPTGDFVPAPLEVPDLEPDYDPERERDPDEALRELSRAFEIPDEIDAPDWSATRRPGYATELAEVGISLEPAEVVHLRPIAGGSDAEPWIGGTLDGIGIASEDLWGDGPSDADWDRIYEMEREFPPSGGLD